MKNTKRLWAFAVIMIISFSLIGCGNEKKNKAIAVFATGILADSPIYQMMADGVTKAVEEYNESNKSKIVLDIIETGTNQSQWSQQLTSVCATGKYDVIIASNPSMPDIALPLCNQFPSQKFIFLDAWCRTSKNIVTVQYRQLEQAYLTGFISGLMSKTGKVGFIAAQEYPIMNDVLLPGFKQGAKEARADCTVDFRIVGNWYDATKGAELADAMYKAGADVILPICGGASQGVISSAKEHGFYIANFDSIGFDKAPHLVISSALTEQKKLAYEMTMKFLNGNVEWGTAREVGMMEGYITFVQDNELYIETVPEDVRERVAQEVERVKGGMFVR